MKTSKIIARALVLLGFGGVVGLATGCRASRAQKSPTDQPVADTVIVSDGEMPVRVMYGVPVVPFDRNKPIRERVAPAQEAAPAPTPEK